METPGVLSPDQTYFVDANVSNSTIGNWKKIVVAIVSFILIAGLVLGFMYMYYPVYVLVCLTSEFMTMFVTSVLLVIFGYIEYILRSTSSARTVKSDYLMSRSQVSPEMLLLLLKH